MSENSTPTPLMRLARRDLLLPTALATSPEGLRAWLAQREYVFDPPHNSDTILRVYTAEKLRLAFASECNQFAVAAIETASTVGRDARFPKNHAWCIIQTYYSAFYSAHAFLRLYARSCTHVDDYCQNAVRPLAAIYSQQFDGGFYSTSAAADYRIITLTKLNNSHEDMWKTYLKLLQDLRDFIPNTPTARAEQTLAIAMLNDIIDGITNGGRKSQGNWLSLIRNSVNYRFEHKVWFPYGHKIPASLDIDQLTDRAAVGLPIFTGVQTELHRFYNSCLSIIGLTVNLVSTCVSEASQVNPIFKNGFCRASAIYAAV